MNTAPKENLQRRQIVRGRSAVKAVLASRPIRGRLLTVYFREGSQTRAGFFVTKSIGGAVTRNLSKRRMREAYRKMKDEFPKGDIIFRLRVPADWESIQKDLRLSARKLGGRHA